MKNIFLALLLAATSTAAMSEWVKLSRTGDLDFYADPSTILNEGKLSRMWVLFDFKTAKVGTNGAFLSITDQFEFDCAGERPRMLAEIGYSGPMASGDVTHKPSVEPSWMSPIPPRTILAFALEVACSKVKQK